MTIKQAQTIFVLGAEGTGMRGLALLLEKGGKKIIRCDDGSPLHKNPRPRQRRGSPSAANLLPIQGEGINLLIYSDAVSPDHPLRQAAEAQNIAAIPYHEALGQFAAPFTTVAITGTHGKSSTTAFLAHILIEAGLDPTVLIGASVPAWGNQNARLGKGEYFVVEADEYREHFLTLAPSHIIITSQDHDHPDYFASLAAVQGAYQRFIAKLKPGGSLITWENTPVADDVTAPLPGAHMRANATLAVAMAEKLGVPRARAIASLKTFSGLGRRLEELGLCNGLLLISDYGHHPTEIAATLDGAREKYPDQKILAVFEAHTLERLKTFFDAFAAALAKADGILLVPVFVPKGRENETTEAAKKLAELETALKASNVLVKNIQTYADLPTALTEAVAYYQIAIGFTAGMLDAKLRQLL